METMTVTADQIEAVIAENPEAIYHLWGEEAEELTEIARWMEPGEAVTISPVHLSERGEQEFARVFAENAPRTYSFEADCESSTPWCAPWHSQRLADYYNPSLSVEDMARAWAKSVWDELSEFLAQCQE